MKHLVQLLIYHFSRIVPAVVHVVFQSVTTSSLISPFFYGQVVCLFWDDELSVTSRSCGPQWSNAFGLRTTETGLNQADTPGLEQGNRSSNPDLSEQNHLSISWFFESCLMEYPSC